MVQYADITGEVMDYLLPELKVIGRYGVGVDTIDWTPPRNAASSW